MTGTKQSARILAASAAGQPPYFPAFDPINPMIDEMLSWEKPMPVIQPEATSTRPIGGVGEMQNVQG